MTAFVKHIFVLEATLTKELLWQPSRLKFPTSVSSGTQCGARVVLLRS